MTYTPEKYQRNKEAHKLRMKRYRDNTKAKLAQQKRDQPSKHPCRLDKIEDKVKRTKLKQVFTSVLLKVDSCKIKEMSEELITKTMDAYIDARAHFFAGGCPSGHDGYETELGLLREFIKERIPNKDADMTLAVNKGHRDLDQTIRVSKLSDMQKYVLYAIQCVSRYYNKGVTKDNLIRRLKAYMDYRQFPDDERNKIINLIELKFQ